MQNSRLPIILLALGLGVLSYQFFLHPTAQEQVFKRRYLVTHADIAEDTVVPESAPKKKFRLPEHQVVGLGAEPQSVATPPPVVITSPVLPGSIEALAKSTDEKINDSKKPKKKKKTVSATPDPKVTVTPYTYADQQVKTPDSVATAGGLPAQQHLAANNYVPTTTLTTATADHNAQTALYWENILLRDADPVATQKFIALYKSKQINDEVLSEVGAAMIADKRLAMRQLGVEVLSNSYNLKNFEALVQVVDTEPASSPASTDALKVLANYSNVATPDAIVVLASALKTTNSTPSLHLEALKLLDAASKQFSNSALNQTTTPANPSGSQIFTTENAHKIFDPFVNILASLLQTSTDSNIKTIASQDITDLQTLLSSQQSASINP